MKPTMHARMIGRLFLGFSRFEGGIGLAVALRPYKNQYQLWVIWPHGLPLLLPQVSRIQP